MTQIPLRKCYAIEQDETDQILLTIVLLILPSMSIEADYYALHGQHRHDICEAMTKFEDEQIIVEEARALALAGPAGATSAPPTRRDDHWGHCGYQIAVVRTPWRPRNALIRTASAWFHPIVADHSNFVCARKLAQKHALTFPPANATTSGFSMRSCSPRGDTVTLTENDCNGSKITV